MAVHNAGYVALLEGNLVAAIESMSEARPVMERASVVNAAICDLDRAEVLRDAGLSSEAESALERVARVFGAHRMLQARAEAELNLARSQLAHDPATAARTASAAARRFRTVDSTAWAAQADGVRVRAELTDRVYDLDGMPAARARRTPNAAEVAGISAALRAQRLDVDATAVDLSAQLHAADRADPGRVVRLPASATIDVRLLAHRVRSRHALAGGRESQARRHAATGIEELAQWQSAFASLDLQSAVRMHGQPLLMDGLSSAMRSGRAEVLFEWSERARHFNQRIVPRARHPIRRWPRNSRNFACCGERRGGTGWRHPARRSFTIICAGGNGARRAQQASSRASAWRSSVPRWTGTRRFSRSSGARAGWCAWSSPPASREWSRSRGGEPPTPCSVDCDPTSTCRHRCARGLSQTWSGNPSMTACADSPSASGRPDRRGRHHSIPDHRAGR